MEKIEKLKRCFVTEKIDGYIVPKNDEFFGEYVPKDNDRLNFISNFSGSYDFALILKNKKLFICGWKVYFTSKQTKWKIFSNNYVPNKMPSDILKK